MAAIKSDVAGRCGKSTSTAEKLEITRLVEESHLSARRKLAKLGILRTTFYRRYDRYLQRGEAGLADQSPQPKHVWNRVPDEVRRKVIRLALDETELSPRELSVMFKNYEQHFVSEFAVYRTLKAHDLFTSPALTVLKAANELKDTTTGINQLLLSRMPARPARQRGKRGKQTSPTSRFWDGTGSISARCATTTTAISFPGDPVPICGPRT